MADNTVKFYTTSFQLYSDIGVVVQIGGNAVGITKCGTNGLVFTAVDPNNNKDKMSGMPLFTGIPFLLKCDAGYLAPNLNSASGPFLYLTQIDFDKVSQRDLQNSSFVLNSPSSTNLTLNDTANMFTISNWGLSQNTGSLDDTLLKVISNNACSPNATNVCFIGDNSSSIASTAIYTPKFCFATPNIVPSGLPPLPTVPTFNPDGSQCSRGGGGGGGSSGSGSSSTSFYKKPLFWVILIAIIAVITGVIVLLKMK